MQEVLRNLCIEFFRFLVMTIYISTYFNCLPFGHGFNTCLRPAPHVTWKNLTLVGKFVGVKRNCIPFFSFIAFSSSHLPHVLNFKQTRVFISSWGTANKILLQLLKIIHWVKVIDRWVLTNDLLVSTYGSHFRRVIVFSFVM